MTSWTFAISWNRIVRLAALMCLISPVKIISAQVSSQKIRGFADIHNHQFANLAFGGKVVVGAPFGPMNDVLSSARDEQNHGRDHTGDIVGAILAARGLAVHFYSNEGYPSFAGWPDVEEVTHQKVHEEWLRRGLDGGLRLMVMMAVDGPPLCKRVATDGRDCDDEMATIDLQIAGAYAMQSYIDQKYGGAGKGWYRVVTSPSAARQAIREGKLAVVLGIETANLFNCRTAGPCNWETQLRKYWSKGVRHFFPIHQSNNAFGGASYFNTILQLDLPTYPCPQYERGHCNPLGLTQAGKALITEMMRLGAIIDVDHMSDLAFSQTLDLAERYQHAGIVASHAGFNEINDADQDHEGQLTVDEYRRIRNVGGMVGLITGQGELKDVSTWRRPGRQYVEHVCGRTSETFAQAYLYALDQGGTALALGTDFGGPLSQPGPRFGPRECLGGRGQGIKSGAYLGYPFIASGSMLPLGQNISGAKTFDFNFDGLAHVGMLPDLIADLEALGIARSEIEPLENSAEAYVRMWEKASRVPPYSNTLVAILRLFFNVN